MMLLRSSRGWERVISELAMLEMCRDVPTQGLVHWIVFLHLSTSLPMGNAPLQCRWCCSITWLLACENFSGDLSLWNFVPFVPQWLNVRSSAEDSPAHACWTCCCNWSKQLHCSCTIYPIIFSGPWGSKAQLNFPIYLHLLNWHWTLTGCGAVRLTWNLIWTMTRSRWEGVGLYIGLVYVQHTMLDNW